MIMYIVLVYDIGEERVARIMKVCRKYLNHIQNSVFEGEISVANFKKMQIELKKHMDLSYDSIIIYRLGNVKFMQRISFGVDKNISNFI